MAVCTGCLLSPSKLHDGVRNRELSTELCHASPEKKTSSSWSGCADRQQVKRRKVEVEEGEAPEEDLNTESDQSKDVILGRSQKGVGTSKNLSNVARYSICILEGRAEEVPSSQKIFDESTWRLLCAIPIISSLIDEEEAERVKMESLKAKLRCSGVKECVALTAYIHKCMSIIQKNNPYPSHRRDRKISDLFGFISRIYAESHQEGYIADFLHGDLHEDDITSGPAEGSIEPIVSGFVDSTVSVDSRLQSLTGWRTPWIFDWGDASSHEDENTGLQYLCSLKCKDRRLLQRRREDAEATMRDVSERLHSGLLGDKELQWTTSEQKSQVKAVGLELNEHRTSIKIDAEKLLETETNNQNRRSPPGHNYKLRERRYRSKAYRSPFENPDDMLLSSCSPRGSHSRGNRKRASILPISVSSPTTSERRSLKLKVCPVKELEENVTGKRKRPSIEIQTNQTTQTNQSTHSNENGGMKQTVARRSLRILANKLDTRCPSSILSSLIPPHLSSHEPSVEPDKFCRQAETSKSLLHALMQHVKKVSGWHPYVWYLMCRRPELEKCAINPHAIARISRKEWDELAKTSYTSLTLFLISILQFLRNHPVPINRSVLDIRHYRYLLAREIQTPHWTIQSTALKEYIAQTGERYGQDL